MHDPKENPAEEAHTHTHEHTHDHEHSHDHGHPHEHHHDHGEARPLDQLYALIRYMSGHNADHTRELEALAGQLKDAGNQEAYALAMEAVGFFDQGNAVLARVLEKLS